MLSRPRLLRSPNGFWITIALGLIACYGSCEVATAGVPTLRNALKPLAQTIADVVVKDQNQTAIAVGDFVGPAELDANAGPGLTETLKSLLNEIQPGIVQRKAPLSLRGRYDKIADPRDPASLILIKVTAEITDRNANRIDEKFAEIRDTRLLADLVGATVSLPAEATQPANNQRLQRAIDKPAFAPDGTKIRTSVNSPYAIEILATSVEQAPTEAKDWANVPARAVRNDGGQAFVDLRREEVYAIRIHNGEAGSSPQESAVLITIDGIDVFQFSEIRDAKTNQPKYTYFVVPPGPSLVTGWHKTNSRVDSFLVTQYGKGAASQAPNATRGKIGVITVQFAPALTAEQARSKGRGAKSGDRLETGFGPSARVKLAEVQRQIGEVLDIISVRYSR